MLPLAEGAFRRVDCPPSEAELPKAPIDIDAIGFSTVGRELCWNLLWKSDVATVRSISIIYVLVLPGFFLGSACSVTKYSTTGSCPSLQAFISAVSPRSSLAFT